MLYSQGGTHWSVKPLFRQVLRAIFLEFEMWINKVSHYIIIAFHRSGAFLFCCYWEALRRSEDSRALWGSIAVIKLVLATWRRMNGDNENWSVVCRHTFKLILSSCLEGSYRSQRARKRERMGGKSCSWGGERTCQDSPDEWGRWDS